MHIMHILQPRPRNAPETHGMDIDILETAVSEGFLDYPGLLGENWGDSVPPNRQVIAKGIP